MKKRNIVVTLAALSAVIGGQNSWADIPTGYFSGKFKKNDSSEGVAQILIQTTTVQGASVSYALVMKQDPEAAIYRIEELDDGSESWIRLVQTDEGLIGASVNEDADFSATRVGHGLLLTPTQNSKCIGEITEIKADPATDLEWSQLQNKSYLERRFFQENLSANVSFQKGSGTLVGKFELAGQTYSGTFGMSEVIPGVAALHAEVLDSESADGHSLDRKVTALVAMINGKGFGQKDSIRFIKIGNGTDRCLDPMSELDN